MMVTPALSTRSGANVALPQMAAPPQGIILSSDPHDRHSAVRELCRTMSDFTATPGLIAKQLGLGFIKT
jgi:hypothetical protein